MLNINLPKVNLDLAEDGKWFEFTDDISFKIARDNNPKHKRALQAKFKQIQKWQEKGDFRKIEHLTNEIIVRYLLKDWKGIKEEGGKMLPFSEDTALTIVSDPQYESIKEFIQDSSRDYMEFEVEVEETVKK